MSHNCKNLLIRCMDFRLRSSLLKWIEQNELFDGGFDVVSLAGSAKSLVDGDEKIKDYFLKQISVSVDLHKADRIIIFHHSDCGAYALDYNFSSAKEEKERQMTDMLEAKKVILEKYQNVEIVLVWGELKDGDGKGVDFEIIK